MISDALPIVYLDAHLVAVHKPAGLLVHPSPVDRRETRSAMKLLRNRLHRWVYPLHRLDRPTSGLLLFALDPDTARRLGEAFERREVRKTYLAVVRGYAPVAGLIDHPLREPVDSLADPLANPDKPPRPARTEFQRLATVELPLPCDRHPSSRYSLLRLEPLTGRRHQLRRHMKHIAHPIVGDTSYGKSVHNRLFREHLDNTRLLLAAMELVLPHPAGGRRLRLSAPLEADFAALLRRLDWEAAVPARWLDAG
jgi:tRNA pseudouridine65 synthase